MFCSQCPIDTRKVLSENLVVIGGTAMLPGFLHRLLAEIRLLVEKPKYSNVLASKNFRIHTPPAKPNCTAWLGGTLQKSMFSVISCFLADSLSEQIEKKKWLCR